MTADVVTSMSAAARYHGAAQAHIAETNPRQTKAATSAQITVKDVERRRSALPAGLLYRRQ